MSRVARWIVTRAVVQFDWGGRNFVPLFQFDASGTSVLPEVTLILEELRSAFDDWDQALWFVQPNCCLGGATPLAQLGVDARAVFEAARVDRFVVRG